MEIRHLRLVQAVAEHKSLSAAAVKLYLTQSALSHQLKELESHYRTSFFSRVGKKMLPTPAGERLLRSASLILGELDKADAEIRSLARGETGLLRLSTECYTCYHWLSPIFTSYGKKFPGVDVRIVAEATHLPVDFLEEGKLDVAIVSTHGNPRLSYYHLFDDELVVIASPKHRFAGQKYISPKDFAGETFIMYTMNDEDSTAINEVFRPNNVFPERIIRMQLTEAIVEMVRANMGVALMARWAVQPWLKSKQIVAKSLTKKGFRRKWSAAVLRGQELPLYLDRFINSLAENMNQ